MVYKNAQKKSKYELLEYLHIIQDYGAGEIIIQSVDNDGTYNGYDLELIEKVAKNVSIPVIALGGAKDLKDFTDAINYGFASAVAAGSQFVYHGQKRAVLINYPEKNQIMDIW